MIDTIIYIIRNYPDVISVGLCETDYKKFADDWYKITGVNIEQSNTISFAHPYKEINITCEPINCFEVQLIEKITGTKKHVINKYYKG